MVLLDDICKVGVSCEVVGLDTGEFFLKCGVVVGSGGGTVGNASVL